MVFGSSIKDKLGFLSLGESIKTEFEVLGKGKREDSNPEKRETKGVSI